MKKLLFSLLAATVFFAACSKDKDDEKAPEQTNTNGLTYNGEFVPTPYSIMVYEDRVGRNIQFFDKDYLGKDSNYTGNGTLFGISFDTTAIIPNTTYTFKSSYEGFDKTKNFSYIFGYYKLPMVNGDFTQESEDKRLNSGDLASGFITVNKTDNIYDFVYELRFKDSTIVKGVFKDTVNILPPAR